MSETIPQPDHGRVRVPIRTERLTRRFGDLVAVEDLSLEVAPGELFALLSGVEGVTGIEEVLIFLADLRTGRRGEPRQRVAFPDDALPAAYQHQVLVR